MTLIESIKDFVWYEKKSYPDFKAQICAEFSPLFPQFWRTITLYQTVSRTNAGVRSVALCVTQALHAEP